MVCADSRANPLPETPLFGAHRARFGRHLVVVAEQVRAQHRVHPIGPDHQTRRHLTVQDDAVLAHLGPPYTNPV